MPRHRKTFREPRFILQMRMRCPLGKFSRPAPAELKRYAEALLQPVQTQSLTLVGKTPRCKIGSGQC